jgi:uncharacterized protein YecE (DUF72 family)
LEVHIGCCGFPQAKKKYYEHFDLVEIQKTFYQLPRVKTAQSWRMEAPASFEFTLKAWQLITHRPSSSTYRHLTSPIDESKKDRYGSFKPTDEVFEVWEKTREVANALDSEIVVFQTPPSFGPTSKNISNLREFFDKCQRDKLLLGWEPRGEWSPDEAGRLCHELGLIHVVDPFTCREKAGNIIYWRLHGIGGYRHRYTNEELAKLISFLRKSRKQKAYILFNNINMWEDALRLQALWEKNKK